MKRFPNTSLRLGTEAEIIESKNFENAIVKIQSDGDADLSSAEIRNVKYLTRDGTVPLSATASSTTTSFAEKFLKRMRSSNSERKSNFMDLRFILAPSIICERLFSKAGFSLTDRRHRLFPSNLECQLYLHVNVEYWEIAKVHDFLD